MDLSRLPVQNGFRLRGAAVSRVETFVDAAFAFAVTLLVVSFGSVPDSFEALYEALRRLPAFVAGFAILALFWHAHHRLFRRVGLEDFTIVVLSLALVAATLFYVYPLRMVMSAAMGFFTGGWAVSEFRIDNMSQFSTIFVIYGVGFAVLAGLIVALNVHALRRSSQLRLDAAERQLLESEVVVHLVYIACAVLSMAIALLLPARPGWWMALPGMAYGLLGVALPIYAGVAQRRLQAALELRTHP
ncbi:TMEM175 family protein [Lysobacter sp. A3-1-A15]|uniref:TMEM175 family protein n=1 Tax=Novilysobacter viscosus TaxID=3098602 RepID=UPI002ED8532A